MKWWALKLTADPISTIEVECMQIQSISHKVVVMKMS